MNPSEQNEVFSYSYSAKEQEEIQHIRQKYIPKEETAMEQLRRLDKSVTKRGTVYSLILGIVSCLVFGMGMSGALEGGIALLIPSILVGVAGLIGMLFAYPVYTRTVRKDRERLAPEIIRLTDELMK